jgi:hypothetical protein
MSISPKMLNLPNLETLHINSEHVKYVSSSISKLKNLKNYNWIQKNGKYYFEI